MNDTTVKRDWRCVEQWTAMELPNRRRGDNPFACRLANGVAWQWTPPMEADFVKKSDYFALVEASEALLAERDALRATIDTQAANYAKATDRADKAEAALKRYGRHDADCDVKLIQEPCTCGFSAALEAK